jgi:hypothetical protein
MGTFGVVYYLSSGPGKRLNEWDSPNQSTVEAVQRLTAGCGGSRFRPPDIADFRD